MNAVSPAEALGTRTARRLTGRWQLWIFAAAATTEIFLASFLFDSPYADPVRWRDPIFYVNTLAKVAIVACCLLCVTAWPRRAEILKAHGIATAHGTGGYYLAANVALFLGLLAARHAIAEMGAPSPHALAAYAILLLASGASLALVAAPLPFWWKLARTAPAEIALAVAGAGLALSLGSAAQEGWSSLSSATLAVAHWILSLYEPTVLLDRDRWLLGVGDFSVEIYGPCSGYEGIALIATFVSAYLWVFRRELRFPNALLLLPLGMAVIWILNALRIALLVSLGAHVSPEIAIHGFHSQAGWISFLFVTLGVVAASRKVAFFAARTPASPCASGESTRADQSLAFLAPFMAMIAANILASAFAPHDQWLYGVKVLAIAAALWWYRDVYRSLLARISWSSVAVGLLVGMVWIATDPGLGQATPLGAWIAALPASTAAAWLALRAVGSVALVPVAEELAFRGFLARWLVSTRFESVRFDDYRLLAFVASSVAFGLLHQRWLAAMLAGAVYAVLMYRTNRLSDPIAAHAASNLAIIAWAVAAGQWSLL